MPLSKSIENQDQFLMRIFFRTLIAFSISLLCFSKSTQAQTSGYSGTGANIDVVYHRAEWRINPDSVNGLGSSVKAISGSVTTYFKITDILGAGTVTFDLRQSAFNNANLQVKYDGSILPAASVTFPTTNVLQISFGVTLPFDQLDSLTIFYGGTPPGISGQAEGFQSNKTNSSTTDNSPPGGNFIYTLAESYEDRDWWPCKADMKDKIDSMDVIVNVPDGFRVATLGTLIDSSLSGANRIFHWRSNYPIASYLIALGVAKYAVYNRGPVNINGTNVPVWYFLFGGKGSYTSILSALDKSKNHLTNFSSKFGDYPFKNEKHGFYEFGWGGGMEHQSFSAMGSGVLTDWSTIAHELAHQWFGDKVTFSIWNELWLAEGFARYCESLALELEPTTSPSETPAGVRLAFKNSARSATSPNTTNPMSKTEVYVPNANITSSNTLWGSTYGSQVYEKGAMVVSMLRKLVGDDMFFQAITNYLNDPLLAYRSATTDDLKHHFETIAGYDFDAFFNDWVYGKGHADYTVNWGTSSGNRINIRLTSQARSTGNNVAYFRTPVVLRINGASTDTTVVIYDQNGVVSYAGYGIQGTRSGNILAYRLSFVPTSITVDPENETMITGTATSSATLNNLNLSLLDINILDFKGVIQDKENLLKLVIAPTQEKGSITLERSENGRQFTTIGNMLQSSNTPAGIVYQFTDQQIASAKLYYYRAKIVDQDGDIKYSKTISLTQKDRIPVVKISPNPVRNNLQITLPAEWQNGLIHINIYNSVGAVVMKEVRNSADVSIKTNQLSAGNYRLELEGENGKKWVGPFTVIK